MELKKESEDDRKMLGNMKKKKIGEIERGNIEKIIKKKGERRVGR